MKTQERKFKTGDVVTSTPNGTKMCVRGYNKENQVTCDWFDGQNQFHREPFDEDQLHLVIVEQKPCEAE